MVVYWYALVFLIGATVGALLRSWVIRRKYGGALVVTREEDRTLYSLELYETVEDLEHRRSITFKVIPPEESLDRD